MKRHEAEDFVDDLIQAARDAEQANSREYRACRKELDRQKERVVTLLMQTMESKDVTSNTGDEVTGIEPNPDH